jgi:hypothetical protein
MFSLSERQINFIANLIREDIESKRTLNENLLGYYNQLSNKQLVEKYFYVPQNINENITESIYSKVASFFNTYSKKLESIVNKIGDQYDKSKIKEINQNMKADLNQLKQTKSITTIIGIHFILKTLQVYTFITIFAILKFVGIETNLALIISFIFAPKILFFIGGALVYTAIKILKLVITSIFKIFKFALTRNKTEATNVATQTAQVTLNMEKQLADKIEDPDKKQKALNIIKKKEEKFKIIQQETYV